MIYVTGDTHGDISLFKLSAKNWPEGRALTKNDFVVILGDFGVIWNQPICTDDNGKTFSTCPTGQPKQGQWLIPDKQEQYLLDWLSSRPWTTLFVDGNHENFDRLLAYPVEEFHGGMASKIHDSVWYLRRGEVFHLCGRKCFVMGGASSIDKDLRIPHKSWWPQEMPDGRDYQNALVNLGRHGNSVDYVFTHSCPSSVKSELLKTAPGKPFDPYRITDEANEILEMLKNRITFRKWYFGHYHMDYEGIEGFVAMSQKVLGIP